MGTRLNHLAEAVLTSTHNLCFEQKYEKYQTLLSDFFSVFCDEILYIFEKACFRNGHNVGIGQIIMSPIDLLKCCCQFGFLIPLAQQLCSEYFPTLHEVPII